ncbi:hypothetical protein [Actinacidiphila oryziradicis]|uniref:Uncharacterized protein n=1 Tax=Actinacidiphila oryziradicis TaxID=2571141 RepID=A0A4U0RYG0_9ACTN|nr:hypothetical protein [Actinacidiphila oryziradicis]TKA00748.1 hypothetical protein FCI23_41940 [Actinacidiphila oryziradicis]
MRTRTARWGLPTAVLIAAGLALTACGPNDATFAAGSSTSSSVPTSSAQPSAQPIAKSSQGSANATPSGTPTKSGVSCTDQINYAGDPRSNAEINSIGEQTGHCPPVSASAGSGVANAGDHSTIVGTLGYLAPGKLIVKPQSGGTDQAFLVSNATQILGAAAICSDTDGRVTIGNDGYGTSKCTVDQLETAAKTDSVTVRVTMNPQSGGAETVEEKYHP